MGRRSRNRAAADPAAPSVPRGRAVDRLNPARRTIAGYLIGAAVIGAFTLVGIAVLGGTFGPILVFLVVLGLAAALQRTAVRRLEGVGLTEEDRLMRRLATGVLVVAVVLSLISAVLSLLL